MAELAQEELKESKDKLDEIDNLLMLEIMPRYENCSLKKLFYYNIF